MGLSTGSLLAGRYEITAPVAIGGMGEVWRARDRVLDRVVAAKVLRSEYTGDPNFLARFRNEARHTAALSHPNIASVYDYGETRDENGATVAYLVMEFVEGETLVSILHEHGRLPVDWTLHVLGQAADGLSAAHSAGVVHRDIKPGNLIVRPDGVVKLTDFGIAQARDAAPLTRTGMVVGTAQYLSPEQAQGMEVAAASDVYSLGVVGYECLAGVRPFDGTSQVAIALAHINRPPPPLPGDVPAPVRHLVTRALAKDPAERFPDGGAFAEAIAAVAGGRQVAAPGTGGAAALGAVGGALAGGAVAATAATTEVLSATDPGGTRVLPATGPLPASGVPAAGQPMPPLRTRPTDAGSGGYPPRRPARRQRRWAWLLAGLALLIAVVGGALLVSSGGKRAASSGASTSSPAASSTAATAAQVFIDTSRYIGRDASTVAAELSNEGLVVQQQSAPPATLRTLNMRLNPNAVAGTTPQNTTVPQGSTVVLLVAHEGYPPAASSSAAPPTVSSSSAARSTPTVSSAPAPVAPAPVAPTPTTVAPTTSVPPTPTPSATPSASGQPAPSGTPTGSASNGAGGSTTPAASSGSAR